MKTGSSLFIFGPEPCKATKMLHSEKHPVDKSMVRFVKHPLNHNLYFNFKDFLKPFKNKKYEKVILNIVPKKLRKLDRIWMNIDAWKEIKQGIDHGEEEEIITEWKEEFLF